MIMRSGFHQVNPPLIGTLRLYLSSILSNQLNLSPPALKSSKIAVVCPSNPSNHFRSSADNQYVPLAVASSIAVLVLPHPVGPASHSMYGAFLCYYMRIWLNNAWKPL